jgi:ubiquinone/menaquinone biosynthesis C-methylase UbiE
MIYARRGYAEALDAYYDSFDEGTRWPGNRGHQLERRTTRAYLCRVLEPNSCILDCCAGTGAYCFDLAKAGHEVVAGDIAVRNVNALRVHPDAHFLESIMHLDACDLSRFSDGCFDAVLVFGAFYHLQEDTDRMRALSEAVRVVKPQGHVAVAYLNRHGCFQMNFMKHPENLDAILNQFRTGIKKVFYRSTPQEIESACAAAGLEPVCHVAADGLAPAYPDKLTALTDKEYERFCMWHADTCEDRDVLGSSVHGLFIGKKMDAVLAAKDGAS